MNIRLQIFLAFSCLLLACCYLLYWWLSEDLLPSHLQTLEEDLVEHASVYASVVTADSLDGTLNVQGIKQIWDDIRPVKALIFSTPKTTHQLRVLVMDTAGLVVFDSKGQDTGSDYSQWNDFIRTMRGEYGARASHTNPDDPWSLVLYVAAPIRSRDGTVIGVLSLGKPITALKPFVTGAQYTLIIGISICGLLTLIMTWFLSHHISKPILALSQHARHLRTGQRIGSPAMHSPELKHLADELDALHKDLAGKDYIERYVQHLTHEFKSPITVIRGAGEILAEHPTTEHHDRFCKHIMQETQRLTQLVDRLLQLAKLEQQHALEEKSSCSLETIAHTSIKPFQVICEQQGIHVHAQLEVVPPITGNAALLEMAISNALSNSIRFSSKGQQVSICIGANDDTVYCIIQDEGPGIPDYALEKVWDRFYSLNHGPQQEKSSGLGLPLIKEICQLHRGQVHIENTTPGLLLRMAFPYR